MKAARLVVLGVALTAGLGAAYLMMGTKEPEPVRVVAVQAPIMTDNVLVASRDLTFGSVVTDADMRWQSWPKDQVPVGVIRQTLQPKAMDDVKGSIVRSNFLAGEPLRTDRLVKGAGSGFLSAVLPGGTRAVAIDLVDQGKSAAGGFILPNDRVDVIRTFHPDDAPTAFASETILTNIRVLAIGQSVQEKAAERTVIGGTATDRSHAGAGRKGDPRPENRAVDALVAQHVRRKQGRRRQACGATAADDHHPLW